MQNSKIGLKNQEVKRVGISTSHIWFTIVFLIRTKKANVQKQIQGSNFQFEKSGVSKNQAF